MTRSLHRRATGLSAAVLLLVTLQACGTAGDNKSAQPQPTASAGTDAAPGTSVPTVERNTFPAYVKHTWGTTIVEREPLRVVSLGLRDHEMLLALGVTPIAIRNAFGAAHPYADWPWVPDWVHEGQFEYLQARLQDPKTGKTADPVDGPIDNKGAPMAASTPQLRQVFDFEHLKSLQPDLIVGAFSGIRQEDYNELVKIAPTISGASPDAKYYYSAWQEDLRALGKATGRPTLARELEAKLEQGFEDFREEHPEFREATVAVVAPAGDGKVRVINPFAPMSRFFTSLRMRFPGVVDSLMNAPGVKATYGVEMNEASLPLLANVDALVWIVGADENKQFERIKDSGYYQSMRVVQRGGAVHLDGGTAEAIYMSSPFSIPWALEKLEPSLVKALEPKKAREAAAEAAAERAAKRAEDNGDFDFEFIDPNAPTPRPRAEETDSPKPSATPSRTQDPHGEPGSTTTTQPTPAA